MATVGRLSTSLMTFSIFHNPLLSRAASAAAFVWMASRLPGSDGPIPRPSFSTKRVRAIVLAAVARRVIPPLGAHVVELGAEVNQRRLVVGRQVGGHIHEGRRIVIERRPQLVMREVIPIEHCELQRDPHHQDHRHDPRRADALVPQPFEPIRGDKRREWKHEHHALYQVVRGGNRRGGHGQQDQGVKAERIGSPAAVQTPRAATALRAATEIPRRGLSTSSCWPADQEEEPRIEMTPVRGHRRGNLVPAKSVARVLDHRHLFLVRHLVAIEGLAHHCRVRPQPWNQDQQRRNEPERRCHDRPQWPGPERAIGRGF